MRDVYSLNAWAKGLEFTELLIGGNGVDATVIGPVAEQHAALTKVFEISSTVAIA